MDLRIVSTCLVQSEVYFDLLGGNIFIILFSSWETQQHEKWSTKPFDIFFFGNEAVMKANAIKTISIISKTVGKSTSMECDRSFNNLSLSNH